MVVLGIILENKLKFEGMVGVVVVIVVGLIGIVIFVSFFLLD